ncbi:hypothetical protein R0K30_17320 [Bacillus sp. SIMBA_154]|uniref:hypothetical protein n=1 Tax=Bacillus sp. SIMBA_154 TaxID=3080859 RepID=UPI003978DC16
MYEMYEELMKAKYTYKEIDDMDIHGFYNLLDYRENKKNKHMDLGVLFGASKSSGAVKK